MIAVSPDRYLDLRSPAWAALEAQRAIEFSDGVVLLRAVPLAIEAYLKEHGPGLTIAEAHMFSQQWKYRYPEGVPRCR